MNKDAQRQFPDTIRRTILLLEVFLLKMAHPNGINNLLELSALTGNKACAGRQKNGAVQ